MTNPIIGYANAFETGTVTASNDPASTPKENAYDWRFDDFWKPAAAVENWLEIDLGAAASIDYIGFYSPDFYSMAGAELNVFSGAAPAPTTQRVQENITTEGPKLFSFASASARYWRVRLDTTAAQSPSVTMLAIGQRLDMEQGLPIGFAPPALSSKFTPINSVSNTGLFLGRSNRRQTIDFSINADVLSSTWVRSNWPGLLAHAESYPFFVLPEPGTYPDEAVIAWTSKKIAAPEYSSNNLMKLSLSLQGFK